MAEVSNKYNHSKQFPTSDTVPPFSLAKEPACVGHNMLRAIILELGEYGTNSCVTRNSLSCVVRKSQDRW